MCVNLETTLMCEFRLIGKMCLFLHTSGSYTPSYDNRGRLLINKDLFLFFLEQYYFVTSIHFYRSA